jgi:hypothetical protein
VKRVRETRNRPAAQLAPGPGTDYLLPTQRRAARFARLLPWILIALVILATAIIRIRLLETPLERDEGEYAYAGQLMLQGIPPYELAYNMKFPGTYGAYALIMAIFGQSIAGIHLGFLIVNAGTIVLVYLLGKRLFATAAGVAAGAAYALLSISASVMGTQAHATHFVVAAAIGGTVLLLRGIDTGRSSTLVWSGLLYGIAILMKQHGLLFAGFGGLVLMWTQFRAGWVAMLRKLALFFCGASLPLAATGLALWWAGVFHKFWFWTVTYARDYVLETSFSEGVDTFRSVFPSIVGPNLAIWIVAAAGLVLIWWRKEDRASATIVTGLLLFSFLAVCPGLYFRGHYFVLMLPAVALLAGAAVDCSQRLLPSPIWSYGLFGAALLVSVLLQQQFLFQMSPLEVSRAMYGPNPFPEAIQVADYIRGHSAKDSRIAVLGSEPEIPFYANRHSATGYIYTYALMEPQPFALTMQNELIHDLETSQPEYVVVVGPNSSWLRTPESPGRIFEWWSTYGTQHYKVVGIADIVSTDHTEYHWDDVESYRPQSPYPVLVYKRKDS